MQDFGFICTRDVLELQAGEAGEGEGLHIEPCLRSVTEKYKTLQNFVGYKRKKKPGKKKLFFSTLVTMISSFWRRQLITVVNVIKPNGN